MRIIPAYAGSTPASLPPAARVADHPRIRGEHSMPLPYSMRPRGSSPHTRGARRGAEEALDRDGIIPAYAGSTPFTAAPPRTVRDHPRIRGEHSRRTDRCPYPTGSSPHTRGAPTWTRWTTSISGGSSPHTRGAPTRRPRMSMPFSGSSPHTRGAPPAWRSSSWRDRDHPRIRGEHKSFRQAYGALGGSSPHTRGALTRSVSPPVQNRIIPAYAGSTGLSASTRSGAGDHPRIRGEHPARIDPARRPVGSSPHTRGAHSNVLTEMLTCWIIPAYAGSTRRPSGRRRDHGDHPRIRGEHRAVHMATSNAAGSSPHTRGAPLAKIDPRKIRRIIPAYAGSTFLSCPRDWFLSDHPRIRGEHLPKPPAKTGSVGSSPHTRGAPLDVQARLTSWRDHPRIRGEHPGMCLTSLSLPGSSPHTRGAPPRR